MTLTILLLSLPTMIFPVMFISLYYFGQEAVEFDKRPLVHTVSSWSKVIVFGYVLAMILLFVYL